MKPGDQTPEQIIRSLRINPAADNVREKARHRALAAFRNAPVTKKHRHFPWWILLLTTAAAIFMVVLHVIPKSVSQTDNLGVFSEVEEMFSGRLLAAIKDGNNLDLKLADSPEALPKDQRVLITLQKNSHLVEVLTYSGQAVNLKLGGHSEQVTPLISGDGSVMIVTENSLIKGTHNSGIDGFTISARSLEGGRS
jgi:hypothetical protein